MAAITIELPSNITYVAGYVNDALTVFYQDSFDPLKWKVEVEPAEDNFYRILIEMHDEAGNIGTYEDTIEYILPVFVYDRIQADVDRVYELRSIGWDNLTELQKQEWLGGLKGCLNPSDLKRIENDLYVIAQLLKVELQTNKDNIPAIPDFLYFGRLLENVSLLRGQGYLNNDTPQVPEEPLNTYTKINDVEKCYGQAFL